MHGIHSEAVRVWQWAETNGRHLGWRVLRWVALVLLMASGGLVAWWHVCAWLDLHSRAEMVGIGIGVLGLIGTLGFGISAEIRAWRNESRERD